MIFWEHCTVVRHLVTTVYCVNSLFIHCCFMPSSFFAASAHFPSFLIWTEVSFWQVHFISITVLCELPGNLHPFLWPNSAILAPWDSPVRFQMSKAVSIHPLPVTDTAHSCLSPVPETWQLWSFVYMNCIYFNKKSGYCTSVIGKANLNHIACLKQKTVGKHLKENQAGQGSIILPPERKQLCSCLP